MFSQEFKDFATERDVHRKGDDDAKGLGAEFRKLQLNKLIPLAEWLKDEPWNITWVRWFLAYGLVPFVALNLLKSQAIDFKDVAWAFSSYFALTWLIAIRFLMKPEQMDIWMPIKVSLFTIIIGISLLLMAQKLPIISDLYSSAKSQELVPSLFGFVLGVGVMEEAAKALAVFLLVYRANVSYRPLTYAFLGAVSGLAFGVAEAVKYSMGYTEIARAGAVDLYLVIQLLRFISLPLLHACWSAMVGYFIGLAAMHQRVGRALMMTGLGLAVVLHGAYDTFCDSYPWIGAGIAVLSLLIFVSYVRTGHRIEREAIG